MSEQITINILGEEYTFDPSQDHILKRGIIDPYDLSPKSNEWVVIDDYVFWSARLQEPVVAPRWFITDLASVPRPLRAFISVNERHRLAALAHDVGYRMLSHGMSKRDRSEWDLVLKDFCMHQGVWAVKAKLMYWGVRAGGWAAIKDKLPLFIPVAHRRKYITWYPHLNLDLADGVYFTV